MLFCSLPRLWLLVLLLSEGSCGLELPWLPKEQQLSRYCRQLRTVCEPRPWRALATVPAGTFQRPRKRLAILVVGMLGRFYPMSSIKHVLGPAARAGYEIDYFALLCRLPMDAGTFRAQWFNPSDNEDIKNLTEAEVQALVVRHARRHNVRRFHFTFPREVVLDDRPPHSFRRRPWRPYQRNDTTFVRNLLWLKAVELLWNESVVSETEDYDQVVLIRSDAFWVDDFFLGGFRDPTAIYSRGFGSSYCPVTEDRATPDDRVIVFGGLAARFFLPRLWTDYYHNPSPELDSPPILGTEHWFVSLARHHGIHWELVSPGIIYFPYFLALHVTKWRGNLDKPIFCLRGCSRAILARPRAPCVSPSKVAHIFCEDGLS